eukprot:3843340-Prymnesium_polylepis.1
MQVPKSGTHIYTPPQHPRAGSASGGHAATAWVMVGSWLMHHRLCTSCVRAGGGGGGSTRAHPSVMARPSSLNEPAP